MSDWDGPDYIRIASRGYGTVDNANFFPLYPLLIHLLNQIISSPLDCALIISWLSLIGAVYFYLKIARKLFKLPDNLEASRAVVFFLLYPTAIFLLASYTESLFACLALGTIYFALNKRWLVAATLALFCSATHITGIFVLVLLFMILIEEKLGLVKAAISSAIGAIGLIAYMIYLQAKFHKPLAFITSQKSHGWLSSSYGHLFGSADFFSALFIVLLIMAATYWWRRRLSLAIYSLLFLLIPIVGRQFGGFDRYSLMAFPVPLMLYGYLRKHNTAYSLVLVLSAIGWTYYLLQYAGGYVGG